MFKKFGPINISLFLLTIFIDLQFYLNFFRMKELRGGIIRLFEEGKNANQIATAMNLDRKTVGRIIHRYQETGSYEDRHRSGRPRTARTPANKRKIKGRIQRNPNSRKNSIRKMAKAFGSVHSILHEDLGMKSRKKVKAQGLN